jgi:phosphopantetheine adenylyltransferase
VSPRRAALEFVEDFDNEADMATINFSIPDEVKQAFNAAFAGQNKSAIVAELMREAIEREARRERSRQAIARILSRRPNAPLRGVATLAAARRAGRP